MDWLRKIIFSSLNAMASTCELLPAHQNLTCQGTFVSKTPQALANYAATLKVKDGFAKHLAIDFDVNQESLSIATPCRIRLRENRKIECSTQAPAYLDTNVKISFKGKTHTASYRHV